MKRKVRNQQWDSTVITQALHLPKAFPELASSFLSLLDEIPATKRQVSLIPLLRNESWAQEILGRWEIDETSPLTVKKAILSNRSKK